MNIFARWLINGLVIATVAILLPDIHFSSFWSPALCLIALTFIVSGIHPGLIDSYQHYLWIDFLLVHIIVNIPLFTIAAVAMPGIEMDGFLPALILSIASAAANSIIQIKYQKTPA